MNIQQLESFIQVAENLSFARAAEVLNMTQIGRASCRERV